MVRMRCVPTFKPAGVRLASFWRHTLGESHAGVFVMRPSEKEDHNGHARC